ncbi:hypothetical protein V2G26_003183 [Clonostachys chloroleuca]
MSATPHKTQNSGKRRCSLEVEEICDEAKNGETAKNSSESQVKGGSTGADSDPGNLKEPKSTRLQIQSIDSITALSSNPTLVAESQPKTVIGGAINNNRVLSPNCGMCGHEIDARDDYGVTETRAHLPCGHSFGHICLFRYLSDPNHVGCPQPGYAPLRHSCGHMVIPQRQEAGTLFQSTTANQILWRCAYCESAQGLKITNKITDSEGNHQRAIRTAASVPFAAGFCTRAVNHMYGYRYRWHQANLDKL